MARLLLALLCSFLLCSCAPRLSDDDDASTDDDDVSGDDDDASGDDDDTSADDDDDTSPGDDDDDTSSGDDDDDTSPGDDDDTSCDVGDLVLSLSVLDANGVAGWSFRPEDVLTLSGSLTNVCDTMLTFETTSGCLLEPWSLSGNGTGLGRGCDDAITTWTVAPGAALVDAEQIGAQSAGTWTWEAGFEGMVMTVTFTVQ